VDASIFSLAAAIRDDPQNGHVVGLTGGADSSCINVTSGYAERGPRPPDSRTASGSSTAFGNEWKVGPVGAYDPQM